MADASQTPTTGAEDVRWDLSDLYTELDDPRLDADLDQLVAEAAAFEQAHRGKLASTLGQALQARAHMDERATKLYLYLHLRRTTDAANARVQQRLGTVFERWSVAEADHLNFFDHELVAIDDATYAEILERDEVARRHRSLLDHLRANRRYLLEETVERWNRSCGSSSTASRTRCPRSCT
jgi:oligoendopeptidase F